MATESKEYINLRLPKLIAALKQVGIENPYPVLKTVLLTGKKFNLAASRKDMKGFKEYAGSKAYEYWAKYMEALTVMEEEK